MNHLAFLSFSMLNRKIRYLYYIIKILLLLSFIVNASLFYLFPYCWSF